MTSIRDRLQDIARAVFDDDELILRSSTTASDVNGWDSLGHISFMYSVEQAFAVKFNDQEYAGITDVGALEAILERKLDASSGGAAPPHG
jgi:acyl carrier protein